MFPRNKFLRSKLIRLIVSFYLHAEIRELSGIYLRMRFSIMYGRMGYYSELTPALKREYSGFVASYLEDECQSTN